MDTDRETDTHKHTHIHTRKICWSRKHTRIIIITILNNKFKVRAQKTVCFSHRSGTFDGFQSNFIPGSFAFLTLVFSYVSLVY